MGIYSAVLGFFVPSGGGKWIIEAPYVMQAANELKVHLGWAVQVYNAAEALPNLINPFWMLPLLGILELKARDVIGFTIVQFIVHVPLVLFLLWAARTDAGVSAAGGSIDAIAVLPRVSSGTGPVSVRCVHLDPRRKERR